MRQERGEVSIREFVERTPLNALSALQRASDGELKKMLASSTITEMVNLPPEISNHIFHRLKENPEVVFEIQRRQFENEHLPGLKNIRDGSDKIASEVEERLARLLSIVAAQASASRKVAIEPHIVKNINNASAVLFLETRSFNQSSLAFCLLV